MKQDKIYEKWKNKRKDIHIPENFSFTIMDEIYKYENHNKKYLWENDLILNRLRCFILALGISALGFFRIGYVAYNLLVP